MIETADWIVQLYLRALVLICWPVGIVSTIGAATWLLMMRKRDRRQTR